MSTTLFLSKTKTYAAAVLLQFGLEYHLSNKILEPRPKTKTQECIGFVFYQGGNYTILWDVMPHTLVDL
jgi:hypothetical protein